MLTTPQPAKVPLHNVSSADITFFKGTRQEMARGVVMQNLGNRMATIMDLGDGSVHRRHYDQIHFQSQKTEQNGAKCSLSVHVTLLILTVYNLCNLFSI